MKKSQLMGGPIMHLLFTIAAVLILIFGITQITQLIKKSKEADMINFYDTLQNSIKKHSLLSYGTVDV